MRSEKKAGDRAVEVRRFPGARTARALLVLGLLAGPAPVVVAVCTTPASAANNGYFSLAPATTGSYQRTFFTPVLSPGVVSHDSVAVINETNRPLLLRVYASDAYTTRDGIFAVNPEFKPKAAMGAWIHLPVSEVTVPPLSGKIIPFTYDPPPGTLPGDYAGGIVAEQTTGPVSGQGGSVKVESLQAVGAAVYGRVIGPLHPKVAVTQVGMKVDRPFGSQFGGGVKVTVTYSVTNTGNENITPAAAVSVSPLLGSAVSAHAKLPQVLPGSTVTFSHTFDDVDPYGDLSASVVARADGATATGGAGNVVVPWGLVGIFVLLVFGSLWRRRVRRKTDVGAKEEAGEDELSKELPALASRT